ncbi:MAG TPA: type IV pilus assembly protein PilM [Methylomirabilota bacterium]|nr:type IV pilus assembly protein PilM [Methylomirabilota bacterium]
MGLFGRKRDVFGLDLGSSAIKAVQLRPSNSGYELMAFGMVELPPDTIREGTIREPGTVVDGIREAVKKAQLSTKDAVIGVSGHSVITKKIRLPKVSAKELAESIQLEAEHHIPFAIDDVYMDYQVMDSGGGDSGGMEVVLAVVKKAKVNEYLTVIQEADLNPVVVDVDAFALENQFELNHPEMANEVVALIDMGASVMKTNVLRRGVSVFARDIAFGGNHYTEAIAQRLNLPFERAEMAKRGQKGVGVDWDDLVPILESVSRELSLEIQRTFDYFASTAEAERIDRIVLSGGCAKIQGIDAFLASSWGIPAEIARPFQNIQFNPQRFPADALYSAGPQAAIAVGLALRQPGDKR